MSTSFGAQRPRSQRWCGNESGGRPAPWGLCPRPHTRRELRRLDGTHVTLRALSAQRPVLLLWVPSSAPGRETTRTLAPVWQAQLGPQVDVVPRSLKPPCWRHRRQPLGPRRRLLPPARLHQHLPYRGQRGGTCALLAHRRTLLQALVRLRPVHTGGRGSAARWLRRQACDGVLLRVTGRPDERRSSRLRRVSIWFSMGTCAVCFS